MMKKLIFFFFYTETTALEYSISKGNLEICELILNNFPTKFSFNNLSPLHLAVKYEQYEIVELLLNKNFDVNYIDVFIYI